MRPRILVVSPVLALAALLSFAASRPAAGTSTEVVESRGARLGETVAPGELLDIRLDTGAGIEIVSWDRHEVMVESGWDREICADGRLSLNRTADGVFLETHYQPGTGNTHHCSMMIRVKVPHRFDVRLRSVGGSIKIMDVGGTFSGETGGGGIELTGVSGRVDLHTGGGEILVRDARLEGRLTTGGGSVRFDNVSGGVTATSGSQPGVTRGGPRVRRASI